jgi:hypothetical protein
MSGQSGKCFKRGEKKGRRDEDWISLFFRRRFTLIYAD